MATASRRTKPDILAEALALLAEGLFPVAIHPPGPKTATITDPGKQPIGKGWGVERPTEAQVRATWRKHPDASLGLALGHGRGVCDLEIDGDGLDADAIEDIWYGLLGTRTFLSRGWSSRRGPHLLVRWDDRFLAYKSVVKGKDIGLHPALEIRIGHIHGKGLQLQSVVPPSPITEWDAEKTATHAAGYRRWNDIDEIAAAPEHLFKVLDRLNEPRRKPGPKPASTTGRRSDAELAEDALGFIDPAGMHYDDWYRIGMALWHLGEPGLDIWDRWSSRDIARYEGRPDLEKHWRSFKDRPGGVGLGSLFDRAKREGWEPSPNRARATKETKETNKGGGNGHPGGASFVSFVNFVPEDADEPVTIREWPESPKLSLWHGPGADFTLAVAPHTEADPLGILTSVLATIGNMVGRAPYWQVGPTRHHLNVFVCTTGPTSSGRKGTAKDIALWAAGRIDAEWQGRCVKSGLSSGEGLIWAVRDPITKREPVRENKRIVDYEDVISDPGIEDKRLLVVETEFGGTLQVLKREGNTLSAILRQAWDDGNLRTLTKNNPAVATDAHISIIAHVTEQEVGRYLSSTDAANGFGNRFLWVSVRRSKYLPEGSDISAELAATIVNPLVEAVAFGRGLSAPMTRDRQAAELWDHLYRTELDINMPGLIGAVLGRAEAQTMRLACLFAILDRSGMVRLPHLEAALELWRYCARSASYIFGDQMGDPDAEALLSAVRSSPEGLTQTQITVDVFQKNKPRRDVARVLGRLLEAGLIESESVPTEGRPRTVWRARGTKQTKETNKAPEGAGASA